MSVKKKKNTTTTKKTSAPKNNKANYKRLRFLFSIILFFTAFALFFSFISYFIYGNYDQDIAQEINDKNAVAQNWLGKFGAYLSHLFIYKGFGVASFFRVHI